MTAEELEAYLHEHIPLTRAMGMQVLRADAEAVCLVAPLEPNVNHQGTAFGGSIATLAIAAGWCTIRLNVETRQIVISEASLRYLKPIQGQLVAECLSPTDKDWQRFAVKLKKRGKARMELKISVGDGEITCAELEAKYVASLGTTS